MSRTIRQFLIAAILVFAAVGLTVPSVAQASPRHPGAGDRITMRVESDQQWFFNVTWLNQNNKVRNVVPYPNRLPTFDRKHRVWTKTISFVAHRNDQKIYLGMQSLGLYAKCTVSVNGVRVAQKVARGPAAQAHCGRFPGADDFGV